jgi:AAA domain
MSLPPEWGCSAVEWRTERDKVRLLRPPACDNVADVAAQMRENELSQPEVVFINGAHIEPQPVRWLWRNHLQRGSLNLLAGKSAAGKSTVALSFAATITSGGPWPDGQVCEAELGTVL